MSREVAEESEGEWVLPEVAIEKKVEEIFLEAENGGLKWRRRGILPVLVIEMLNWLVSFPMMPLVVRGSFAKKLCSFSPRVEKAWRSGSCSFQAFKKLAKAVIHSRSKGLDNPGFEVAEPSRLPFLTEMLLRLSLTTSL